MEGFSLSMACRLCLINSVITGSFLHSFQVYRWPSSLLKDLNAAIQKFFGLVRSMVVNLSKLLGNLTAGLRIVVVLVLKTFVFLVRPC